mgnify:CR=1 FL=1
MVHSGQESATTNPAKAVQYVCRLLRSFGLGDQLTPELLRKAKFDIPAVSQPTQHLSSIQSQPTPLLLIPQTGLVYHCITVLRTVL